MLCCRRITMNHSYSVSVPSPMKKSQVSTSSTHCWKSFSPGRKCWTCVGWDGPLWLLDIQSRCYSTFFIILCNIVAWPRVWGFWEYKFWLNEQLSHNSGQTSCRIYLKLWDSQARSTFGHATSRPNCSVVSDWSSSLHAFADKLLVSLTSNLVFF